MNLKFFIIVLSFALSIASEVSENPIQVIYQKPTTTKHTDWIFELEQKREVAYWNQNHKNFEDITKEICATLAGKYTTLHSRWVRATPEQAQIILYSIIRTRNYYNSKPNLINEFYLAHNPEGCKKMIEQNLNYARYMGTLIATDAMHFGIINPSYKGINPLPEQLKESKTFEHWFSQQQKVEQPFKKYLKQIVADIYGDEAQGDKTSNALVDQFFKEVEENPRLWTNLIEQIEIVREIFPPQISLTDFYAGALCEEEEDFKGWKVHKLTSKIVAWEQNQHEEQDQQNLEENEDNLDGVWGNEEARRQDKLETINRLKQKKKELIKILNRKNDLQIGNSNIISLNKLDNDYIIPLTTTAVLLKENNYEPEYNKAFKDIPELFDNRTIAIEYSLPFYMPGEIKIGVLDEEYITYREEDHKSRISFNLTRKLNPKLNPALLSLIKDRDRRILDHNINIFSLSKELYKDWPAFEQATTIGLGDIQQGIHIALLQTFGQNILNAYEIKAGTGDTMYQFYYALGLESFDQRLDKARTYYKMASNFGNTVAYNNYANLLLCGKGGTQDIASALQYYKIAADNNIAVGQYNYAAILYQGKLCNKNPIEARAYAKLAACQDHIDAQYLYGIMCFKAEGGTKDLQEALKYLKQAADQEHMHAQRDYALILETDPSIIEKPWAEIRRYYRMAADQGDEFARQKVAPYRAFRPFSISKQI